MLIQPQIVEAENRAADQPEAAQLILRALTTYHALLGAISGKSAPQPAKRTIQQPGDSVAALSEFFAFRKLPLREQQKLLATNPPPFVAKLLR